MSDDNKSANDQTGTQGNTAELPEWGRRAIAEANAEAAKYRVKAQSAADEAKAEAKVEYDRQLQALSQEKTSIMGERDNAVTGLTKLKVAIAADVPGEQAVAFADLLQGSTEDELNAHAKQLKEMFGTPVGRQRATDRTQSAGGSASGVKTPGELFADMVQSKITR
jgi:hypothetical protein